MMQTIITSIPPLRSVSLAQKDVKTVLIKVVQLASLDFSLIMVFVLIVIITHSLHKVFALHAPLEKIKHVILATLFTHLSTEIVRFVVYKSQGAQSVVLPIK